MRGHLSLADPLCRTPFQVEFVIDLSEKFFQKVFQGDDPRHASIFVYHDSEMNSMLLEIFEKVVQFLA